MQLQDDMLLPTTESMLGLLGDPDSVMMKSDPDLSLIAGPHLHTMDDAILMPQPGFACKDTDADSIRSLLASPSSPFNAASTPEVGSELTVADTSSPLSSLNDAVSPRSIRKPQNNHSCLNEQNPGTHMCQPVDSVITSDTSEQFSPSLGKESDKTENSSALIDRLLGLKTLFKDPTNSREFKTDYLKGFTTEKQDCNSIRDLFQSIQHPADALDIALAKAADENLDKLIDQTIEAFDKQNFLTRGFLAKMPDYQHRFLVRVGCFSDANGCSADKGPHLFKVSLSLFLFLETISG